ncbi:MAG: hypothetical protein HDT42_04700 [Ruminococcaceae bacterium]|nr:hypothetical protein [Oscillospiraceae bacterium]
MTIQSQLLESICNDLGLKRGTKESSVNFTCRAVYSAIGRLAYASLWDEIDKSDNKYKSNNPDDNPSIVHFKRRIEKSFGAYAHIFPEITFRFSENTKALANSIFTQFEHTGQFYRSPYRVSPPIKSVASEKRISFVRGFSPFENTFASGLGAYQRSESVTDLTVNEMFNIPKEGLAKYWNNTINRTDWWEITIGDKFDFLNHNISKGSPYWIDKPDLAGNCSMMRSKEDGNRAYYLYKIVDGKFLASKILDFMVQKEEYLNLANGCLAENKLLPKSRYNIDGSIVTLEVGYLYPPSVRNLVDLYSWPINFRNVDESFNRIIDAEVFISIKSVLENIGFEFMEV